MPIHFIFQHLTRKREKQKRRMSSNLKFLDIIEIVHNLSSWIQNNFDFRNNMLYPSWPRQPSNTGTNFVDTHVSCQAFTERRGLLYILFLFLYFFKINYQKEKPLAKGKPKSDLQKERVLKCFALSANTCRRNTLKYHKQHRKTYWF